MSESFSTKYRHLLITFLDIVVITVFFFFLKGYYSLTPIAVSKIDEVQYRFLIADFGNHFRLSLVVKNLGKTTRTFQSREGRFVEMSATLDEKRVWTWSKDKFFFDREASFTLEPDEKHEIVLEWNKLDDWGEAIGPGLYELTCKLLFLEDAPGLTVKLEMKENKT